MPSTLLTALLKYSKQENMEPVTWETVAEFISPIYHSKMNFGSTLHLVIAAYYELVNESRYECHLHLDLQRLILAPISGFNCMGGYSLFHQNKLTDKYSIEEFYNSMIAHMISSMRLARVDWCKDELSKDISEL